jgi:DNA polymerase I-like protein with 3'-5' exonuclease and polymerase domains
LFIPNDGYRIVECDYASIEVRAAAFCHQDPQLITYICDKTTDMHKDMASQCYAIPKEMVSKQIRYCGKNMFVFPSFYGSYYKQTAPHLWDALTDLNLTTTDGKSLLEHVKSTIGSKEDFTEHINQVEQDFWNNRFKVYSAWKKSHYESYLQSGEFHSLTGFRFNGVYRKNQVINLPIQSVAFHCLLWSFIEMTRIMVMGKWKSGAIGQIHDSLVAEVHETEFSKFKDAAVDVMTQRLPEAWTFINVPLEVEIEATEVNGSWFTKKAV